MENNLCDLNLKFDVKIKKTEKHKKTKTTKYKTESV